MTCKNCLHYEACKGTYFALEERIIDKDSFDNEHYADIYTGEIGKTVFLTREEAEKALKD